MEIINSIKKACLALCHWTTFSRLIMPDYHINEGAVVVQFSQFLSSIDRCNSLELGFEVSYLTIGEKLGFNIDLPLGKSAFADIVVYSQDMTYVFEVKSAFDKSAGRSKIVPKPVRDDILKLSALVNGINSEKVRCFVIYLTQQSHINTAITYTPEDSVNINNVRKAKRSIPKLDELLGGQFKVKLRSVSKSNSTIDRLLGDYCYLMELTLKSKIQVDNRLQ